MSTYFEGEQMVDILNMLNVDVACLGNHELDWGINHCKMLMSKTKCPWLMANLLEIK